MKLFLPHQGMRNVVRALYNFKNLASDQRLTVTLTGYLLLNLIGIQSCGDTIMSISLCDRSSEASFPNPCA